MADVGGSNRIAAAMTIIGNQIDEEQTAASAATAAVEAALGAQSPGVEAVRWFVMACTRPPLSLTLAQIVTRADQLAGVWLTAMSFGAPAVYRVLAVRWAGPDNALAPGQVLRTPQGRMHILRVMAP